MRRDEREEVRRLGAETKREARECGVIRKRRRTTLRCRLGALFSPQYR